VAEGGMARGQRVLTYTSKKLGVLRDERETVWE